VEFKDNPDWEGIPHTDKLAMVTATERVKEALVLHAKNVSYRRARLAHVRFEVSPEQKTKLPGSRDLPAGKSAKIRVICTWYGVFPPSQRFVTVTVTGSYTATVERNVEVIRNLGRR
jgi:hypothetical protein